MASVQGVAVVGALGVSAIACSGRTANPATSTSWTLTMAKTYAQKLQDPRWQKARLRKLEEAGWACENCGDEESQLHVHHPVYVKGREPWEYPNEELQVLCHVCHSGHHEAESELSSLVASNSRWASEIFGLIAGWTSERHDTYPDTPMGRVGSGRIVACGQFARFLYCDASDELIDEIKQAIIRYNEVNGRA